MAAAKSRTSIWSAHSVATGSTQSSPDSSAWIDLSTAYGGQLDLRITNGTSAPSVGLQVQIVVAADGSHTLPTAFGGAFIGGTTASEVDYLSVEIPIGVNSLQLQAFYASNPTNAVTVDADISVVTSV
ncbi:MAG TPA: hypothetical protein VJ770_21280 [Stellaceae bacterium]|nr:hypothetical protein [Stellaceae bacterium]